MCESLVKKVPMAILAPIPGQEWFNAKWLLDHEAACWIRSMPDASKITEMFLEGPDFSQKLQKAIAEIRKPNATKDLANFVLSRCK